ncbi:Glycosyl transferases group 1 [Thiothrix caldifontis]|uniref:Glycosyl transferases group 1 n=1 Tax=Thiothrix caldifontis TaxID=525918 RepID=A0A1H4DLA1_9GAMM|nr:glycosyltransferase [Thiothrix caldifontis]SEA73561.1 Glycosyl transferases group 1 [Thiothrix caldifontis]
MIVNSTISIYAKVGNIPHNGVSKKIRDIASALKENGHIVDVKVASEPGIRGHLNLALNIIKNKSSTLIIRMTAFSMLILILPMIINRLKGNFITLEIPTPISSIYNEVKISNDSEIKKNLKKTLINISFPISLLPANKIVYYADETENYYITFVKNKMQKISNGINCKTINIKKSNIDQKIFTMVSVSSIEKWHGLDRVIFGIRNHVCNKFNPTVRLYIIGTGVELPHLKKLVQDNQLTDYIFFIDPISDSDLDIYFDNSHIAFSSLGLHRKNLIQTSELKNREYAARGIPMVMSEVMDIDFPDQKFIYHAPSNDEPINIKNIYDFYLTISNNALNTDIRSYAEKVVDYRNKVKNLLPL